MRAALFVSTARLISCLLLGLMPSTWSAAQHPSAETGTSSFTPTSLEPPRPAFERPAHLFVVRVSADVLSQQLNRRIDVTLPVRDVIFGHNVSGQARLVGNPRVELIPSSNEAHFNMIFSGTVYSRTVCNGGPANIYGHSITSFTAMKEVVFESGKGFHALPSKIAATTRCYTDNIATSRGGIIGRITERRVSEEVAAKQSQLVVIARDRAVRRIEAAFNEAMAARVAHLNQSLDFQIQLASARTREGSRRLMACTTPQYLEIADTIYDGSNVAIELPSRRSFDGAAPPIEVWVHNSLIPEKIAAQVTQTFKNPDQSAVVNVLSLLPGILGKEAAAGITAFAAEKKVNLGNVGDWFVIDVNAADRAATETAVARRPLDTVVPGRR
jgi:hypothetical protein